MRSVWPTRTTAAGWKTSTRWLRMSFCTVAVFCAIRRPGLSPVNDPERASFKERLDMVETAIGAACRRVHRSRGEVRLMAVSKMHTAEAIVEAIAAGVTLFGENRVQEFAQKSLGLAELGVTPGGPVSFHLIGHLQSNKS